MDKKKSSNPCWKGYKKVEGKSNYEKGSCKKAGTKKPPAKKK